MSVAENTKDVIYVGKDLEAMAFAANYHRWILAEYRPFVGKHIVEVGAGTGLFSTLLLGENPASLSLVEPSEMYAQLVNNISSESIAIKFYNNVFSGVCDDIVAEQRPDTIIYINVLEHIEDDRKELRHIYDSLVPGGHALIFVPALPILYGAFDRAVGHFRRYVKKELVEKSLEAGFKIRVQKFFDFAGIFPWFVKYRIFGSAELESSVVRLYDTYAVPLVKLSESLVSPPLGKNLLFVLQKPLDAAG
jgi:SAM-dependent methyltransferase